MPKNIRLIGLDLDRTMLNSSKEVTPRVRQAVINAINAGIVVLPATGRSLSVIPSPVLEIPGVLYALTSNGAKVYNLQDDTVIYKNCFNKQQLKTIFAECSKYDTLISVFVNGVAYMEPFDFDKLGGVYEPETVVYMRKARDIVPNLAELIENNEEFEKISVLFKSAGERARAWSALEALGSCTVTSSMQSNIEINATNCDKGIALLELAKLLGIKREQVMAIGDSSNDLEMLKAVGYAVAMEDSEDCILAVAHSVTKTADEDGVALAIEGVLS